jgi:hypothetical protein
VCNLTDKFIFIPSTSKQDKEKVDRYQYNAGDFVKPLRQAPADSIQKPTGMSAPK